ncbi:ricin-like [Mercurialis annua]|uniref:ricin-like n=1 Tax=Mercurialis annua TaxID=3986 RepID=UPI00215E30DB|nr:ricin-like [Mercurialis annua]
MMLKLRTTPSQLHLLKHSVLKKLIELLEQQAMEGKESSLWLHNSHLMLLWLCFGSTLVFSLTASVENSHIKYRQQPRLRLDVANLRAETYIDFIDNLRNRLRDPNEDTAHWHGYNVLREAGDLLLVELSNGETESVTFAINVTNVYGIAFRVENHVHYFASTPPIDVQNAFPDVAPQNRHLLPFGEGYDSLQSAANVDRDQIDLGADPLQSAVTSLYYDSRNGPINYRTQRRAARSIIIWAQMIAEAARNFVIAGRISTWIHNSEPTPPEPDMIEYENSWGTLSERIQQSGENGVFDGTQLVDRRNNQITVSNVNDFYVRFAIALMLYVCQPQQQTHFSPLIILKDDTCENPEEPIVRISGPNGLCAGVKDGDYRNRRAIVLQPCKSSSGVRQIWTIKKNGMIQSNGKCLTCYGNQPGDYVMINDCPSQRTDKTLWKVWDNGTIVSGTGLVLSANAADEGTILRLENNIYTTAQSWRPTTYTQPFTTSITGLNRLCLQATGKGVWLETCASDNEDQTWVLYPDGSIRPRRSQGYCLFGDIKNDRIVRIVSCYALSEGQRWEFKSDGSIVNLNYDMVLDVARSDPSLNRIVIWPSTGNANQKWSPVF